jgi:hypothetical protein
MMRKYDYLILLPFNIKSKYFCVSVSSGTVQTAGEDEQMMGPEGGGKWMRGPEWRTQPHPSRSRQ